MIKYPVKIIQEGAAFLAEFPDAPEAHTFGDTKEECLRYAVEALLSAFIIYMMERKEIPPPSRIKRGMDSVMLPAIGEAKVALYGAMRQAGIETAELARRLNMPKLQVERLIDLRYKSRLDQLEQAFAILGKRIHISVEAA